jgi:hypothetical protein
MRIKNTLKVLFVLLLVMGTTFMAQAQEQLESRTPSAAMIRSFILPGWGQFYADKSDWNAGKIYLAADIALIGAWVGYSANANRLHDNMVTLARTHAQVDLKGKGRQFRLNVGDFPSVADYNDYQERTRNWDRLYNDTSANFWNWESEEKRRQFVSVNNRIEQNRQQIPAIISLMVVNRLISGIGAFTVTRNQTNAMTALTITLPENTGGNGVQANLVFRF